jgi:hypothetical protein
MRVLYTGIDNDLTAVLEESDKFIHIRSLRCKREKEALP